MKTTASPRTFKISQNGTGLFTVNAIRFGVAATRAAQKLYGHPSTISCQRIQGEPDKNSLFQAYIPLSKKSDSGLTSIGEPFHVREVL